MACIDTWFHVSKYCDCNTLLVIQKVNKNFKEIVSDNKIQKVWDNDELFALKEYKQLFFRVLENNWYNADLDSLLYKVCESGYSQAAKYLINSKGLQDEDETCLNIAFENGHLNTVQMLLKSNPQKYDTDNLLISWVMGDEDTLDMFLNVKDDMDYGKILCQASGCGHIKIVKLLLQEKRVSPNIYYYRAALKACAYGRIEVIKVFLQDDCFDPTFCKSKFIEEAIGHGNHEIVGLLLQDGRANPNVSDNKFVYAACTSSNYWWEKYIKSVCLLLADPRVDSTVNYHKLVNQAIEDGNEKLIYTLFCKKTFKVLGYIFKKFWKIPTVLDAILVSVGICTRLFLFTLHLFFWFFISFRITGWWWPNQ